MFKRISLLPILVGGAGGFLSAAIAAVFFWALLLLIGADETALTGGIVLGVVVGTFVSGFVAGNAHPRAVFHGALTGVALAGGITIVALGEGSPASRRHTGWVRHWLGAPRSPRRMGCGEMETTTPQKTDSDR